jgi:peptidoglycan hydrolase-like protein with peptidoglycan-binding domain
VKTKAQLATAVLRNNRFIGANEEPSAADGRFVEDAYDDKWAEWRRRGFVWWENTSRSAAEIPAEVFGTLSDLMVNEVQGSFTEPMDPVAKMEREEQLLRRLRRLNHKPPSGESTPFSAF